VSGSGIGRCLRRYPSAVRPSERRRTGLSRADPLQLLALGVS